jgi:uncharacterized protein (TIGR03435 family)
MSAIVVRRLICITASAMWLLNWVAFAQTKTSFEVASIKQVINPNERERTDRSRTDISFLGKAGNPFQISGTRVMIQGTALSLIMAAYDVQPYQVTNAPAWADSLIYSVTAKADGDTAPKLDQVRLMMQSLLSDRFHLELHPDTKEMNVYHLSVGKKNTGLKPSGADEKFDWKLTNNPNGLRSTGIHEPIGDFVRLVGVSADRPVIDKTGLTGFIDYDITINAQDVRGPDDANRAILDAIKDQLGLKLEPAKDVIHVLIVDRIEKPSEN